VRLVVDMNLTPRWVPVLAQAGHDAVHWSAIGDPAALDAAICEWARTEDRVILTNDLDFPQLLAHSKQAKPSVILLRGEPLVPEVRATLVLTALQQCETELLEGAILTLDWSGAFRCRILPVE
jgi:predicted nuclease of predicted toxin-antitoxin system